MTERYAEIIKSAVSVPRMLEFYGFDLTRHNRIPCPIHQGQNQNFGYKDDFWHCFVCGAGGDVIAFVQAYFHLNFMDAVKKLNNDFRLGLPIGEKPTLRQHREMEKKVKAVLAHERERQKEHEELNAEYKSALSEWAMLDKARKMFSPKTPEEFESASEMYIYTLFHIEGALYRLEQAEERLYQHEHSR